MKILIILTIFILLGCILYFGYPIRRAMKISARIEEDTITYQQHPVFSTMKILVMGDSTAVGTGSGNVRYSTAGRLGDDFPDADITNVSENGLKLEGLEKKMKQIPRSNKYDLILLQIGANDIVGFTSQNKIKERIASVLKIAIGHSQKVIVITGGNIGLSPVFHAPLSSYISIRTRALRSIFIKEINRHPEVQYVDLYKDFEDDIFIKDIDKYYAEDLFHPSKDGYAVWYEEIAKILDSY